MDDIALQRQVRERLRAVYDDGARRNNYASGRIDYGLAGLGEHVGVFAQVNLDPTRWTAETRGKLQHVWAWGGIPIVYSPYVAADTMLIYGGREPSRTVLVFKDAHARMRWAFYVGMRQAFKDLDLALLDVGSGTARRLDRLRRETDNRLEIAAEGLRRVLREVRLEREDAGE